MSVRVLPSCMTGPEGIFLLIAVTDDLPPPLLHMKACRFPAKPNSPFCSRVHPRWDVTPLLYGRWKIHLILSARQLMMLTENALCFLLGFSQGSVDKDGSLNKHTDTSLWKGTFRLINNAFPSSGSIWAPEWRRLYGSGNVNTLGVLAESTGGAAKIMRLTLGSGVGGWKRPCFTPLLDQQRQLAAIAVLILSAILNNAVMWLPLFDQRGRKGLLSELRALCVPTVLCYIVRFCLFFLWNPFFPLFFS